MAGQGVAVMKVFTILLLISAVPAYYGIQSFLAADLLTKLTTILLVGLFLISPLLIYVGRSFVLVVGKVCASVVRTVLGKKIPPEAFLQEHLYNSMVMPTDLDHFVHMNNARYQREIDFARWSFYEDGGFITYLMKSGARLIMSSSVMRYRKSLEPFQRFTIKTKVVFWDDDSFYINHNFISRFKNHQEFVYATCLTKMHCTVQKPHQILSGVFNTDTPPQCPAMTEEVKLFINYNAESSQRLRNETKKE
uniref:Protein THEM6 n=1 Tax=Ciona savignyi TaxID=51511 RepID=H2YYG6_CIOSA